jgi:predicted  nucleic acid-binding Zn-ribbon protein
LNLQRTIFICAAVALAASVGCKNQTAIQALKDATTQLADSAKSQNDELATLAQSIETCKTDVANVLRKAAVIKSETATFEVPAMPSELTVASLEAYKTALMEILDKQKAKLAELKTAGEACTKDLAAAKAKVVAAAKKAAPQPTAKPVVVEKREEAGQATKGVKSRYKTKQ